MLCARMVAVVVPSPATSLVLEATSRTIWAPMFSKGSLSSISLATVRPSLVIVGPPNFFSRTTFRPFGPRVTFTASASWFTPHFHFGEETHADQFVHSHKGYSVLIGLLIHTFFDGIAIASGFLVSQALGWIIFLAVFLHKIPEGFTISSVMLASGRSRAFAWGSSVALGVATVAGVMTMAIFRHEVSFGLPLSAGVTIYVAASDLIPEVNKEPGVKMALLVFVGAACMFALDRVFHP